MQRIVMWYDVIIRIYYQLHKWVPPCLQWCMCATSPVSVNKQSRIAPTEALRAPPLIGTLGIFKPHCDLCNRLNFGIVPDITSINPSNPTRN